MAAPLNSFSSFGGSSMPVFTFFHSILSGKGLAGASSSLEHMHLVPRAQGATNSRGGQKKRCLALPQ